MIKNLVAIILSGCAILGCAGHASDDGFTLNLAYERGLLGTDPHTQNDGVTGAVLSAVFEPLVRMAPGAQIEPCLAARWTTPSDTRWTFKLREGVFFHDGRPVTAADVVASIRRARFDPQSRVATYLKGVEKVFESPDQPGVIEIETSEPFPLLLARVSMIAIMPADRPTHRPVGTGPYLWVAGDATGPILLERWSEYWGKQGAFPAIRISFVADEAALMENLKRGSFDVVARVAWDEALREALEPEWRVEKNLSAPVTMLGLNVRHPILADPRVRQAIDSAIDRELMVNRVFSAGEARVARSLVPPEVCGFNPEIQPPRIDEEYAQKLIKAAEVQDGAVLHLDYASLDPKVVEVLVKEFSDIGLVLKPRRHQHDAFVRRIENSEVDCFVFSWNYSQADSSGFLEAFVHSRQPERSLGNMNASSLSDPRLDGYIEMASKELRSRVRLDLLRRAAAMLAEERPYLPLYRKPRLTLIRRPFAVDYGETSWLLPQDIRWREDKGETSRQR